MLTIAFVALLPTLPVVQPTAYPLDCFYAPQDGELGPQRNCAWSDGKRVRIAPEQLRRMTFDQGLAWVNIQFKWFYVRPNGMTLHVRYFDNGPDPFAHGLTRGWANGKVAFYDRRFRLKLATPYDFATPFDARGRSDVCTGCTEQAAGEHSVMVGGRWGVIDRRGRAVIAVTHARMVERRTE